MEYIGTNKNECTIKVGNASVDDSVTWKANLLTEPTGKSIAITVATPLENITQAVTPQSIGAGEEGVVNCTVFGGEPAPVITFFNGATVEGNSNLTVTSTANFLWISVQVLYLTWYSNRQLSIFVKTVESIISNYII